VQRIFEIKFDGPEERRETMLKYSRLLDFTDKHKVPASPTGQLAIFRHSLKILSA
jgi:hypothetical protein